jgi:prevent-host-death family protein
MKPRKIRVGVRQLKANLSSYLRQAAGGEQIEVTDRGHPVATIGPPVQAELPREEIERRIEKLRKAGRILPGKPKRGGLRFLRNSKPLEPPLTKKQREEFWRDFDRSREDKF